MQQSNEGDSLIDPTASVSAEKDPSNTAFQKIAEDLLVYSNSITDSMRASKEVRTEAGSPLIATYRLSQSIPNYINIDIKCSFRWLDCPKKKITIILPFPSQIQAPAYTQKHDFVNESALSTELSTIGSACRDLIFWTTSTMQSVLNEAEQTQGIDKKNIELYFSAYKLAANDVERVHIIECLINRYGKYCDYLISSPDFHRHAPAAKKKMTYYLNCLPNNYQTVSETANAIRLHYQIIFECISEQNIDEAWEMFDPYTKLSPFIISAFPHLSVIRHLLIVIFRVSGHDQYYGLDEALFIPEHDIVASVHSELVKISNFLIFDLEQQNFIQQYTITPIASLLKTGSDGALATSQETILLRREQEITHTRECIKNQLSIPSYRSRYDDIDAEEVLIVEELPEEALSLRK